MPKGNPQPNLSPRQAPINTFALAFDDYLNVKVEQLLRFDKNKVTARRAIALEQVKKAVKGDLNSTREVIDRVEGKAKQPIEQSGGVDLTLKGLDQIGWLKEALSN